MTYTNDLGFEPLPNVSIDDFDEVTEPHEFSSTYQARKAALLGEYRARCVDEVRRAAVMSTPPVRAQRRRSFGWKAAVIAAAAALIALPAAGWAAASNIEFFAEAFGTAARTSVTAHDETFDQGGKTITVTYPTREYVDVDPEEAERLLGEHLMTTPVEVMAGDHRICVLSAVRDADAAVIHYTVSREGGVTALVWDGLSNESKGASIADDAPYFWEFALAGAEDEFGNPPYAGSHIFVNGERSDADTIDCYAYIALPCTVSDDQVIDLRITQRTADGSGPSEVHPLPAMKPLPTATFTTADGMSASVSSIGMRLNDQSAASDPGAISSMKVRFGDETEYVVCDDAANIDNTSYVLGRSERAEYVVIFNRLVDPSSIEAIVLNGAELMPASNVR